MIVKRDKPAACQLYRFRHDIIGATITAAKNVSDVYIKPLYVSRLHALENFPRVIR